MTIAVDMGRKATKTNKLSYRSDAPLFGSRSILLCCVRVCRHGCNLSRSGLIYDSYCELYNFIGRYPTLHIRVLYNTLCGSTKCSPTQYAPFSSILCTLHTQYAPLEHFVYPAYTICYQWSILCRVDTYVISVVVRGYTICSS